MSEAEDQVRIDVWLWRARFFKTRALAARTVVEGAVRLVRGPESRTLEKPHATVRPGDGLTIRLGAQFRSVHVLSMGERRGPAREARLLYAEAGADLDGGKTASQTVMKSGGEPPQ
jgi:ribosome-associated heat shock protein Hsp15